MNTEPISSVVLTMEMSALQKRNDGNRNAPVLLMPTSDPKRRDCLGRGRSSRREKSVAGHAGPRLRLRCVQARLTDDWYSHAHRRPQIRSPSSRGTVHRASPRRSPMVAIDRSTSRTITPIMPTIFRGYGVAARPRNHFRIGGAQTPGWGLVTLQDSP